MTLYITSYSTLPPVHGSPTIPKNVNTAHYLHLDNCDRTWSLWTPSTPKRLERQECQNAENAENAKTPRHREHQERQEGWDEKTENAKTPRTPKAPRSPRTLRIQRTPKRPKRQMMPSSFLQSTKYFFFFTILSVNYMTSGSCFQGNIFCCPSFQFLLCSNPVDQSSLHSTKSTNDRCTMTLNIT